MCPVGAGLYHADGQTGGRADRPTDLTKLTVAFCNYVNTPKTYSRKGAFVLLREL